MERHPFSTHWLVFQAPYLYLFALVTTAWKTVTWIWQCMKKKTKKKHTHKIILPLCHYLSGSEQGWDIVPSLSIFILQHMLEKQRRKTGKKFQSVPVKVITMLVYSNTGKQAVIDHWCPAVPPLKPHLINCSTWIELAAWTKQQHVMCHSLFSPSNLTAAEDKLRHYVVN